LDVKWERDGSDVFFPKLLYERLSVAGNSPGGLFRVSRDVCPYLLRAFTAQVGVEPNVSEHEMTHLIFPTFLTLQRELWFL
jgi:hypothetical protein